MGKKPRHPLALLEFLAKLPRLSFRLERKKKLGKTRGVRDPFIACVELLKVPICCQPHGKTTGEGQISILLVWLRRYGSNQRIGWMRKCKKKTFLFHLPWARQLCLWMRHLLVMPSDLWGFVTAQRLCSLGLSQGSCQTQPKNLKGL